MTVIDVMRNFCDRYKNKTCKVGDIMQIKGKDFP